MTYRLLTSLFFIITICVHCCVQASDIAVVSMAIGSAYEEKVASSLANKQAYCEMHGYDFISTNEWLDSSRPIPWSKIKLLQDVLAQGNYQWIFWTDADALIMNMAIPLEDLIDPQYDLIITKDLFDYNSGNFLLRNSEWSIDFLERVYSHAEYINDPLWENRAIIHEINHHPEIQSRTKTVPQRIMNSYSPELMSRFAHLDNPLKMVYRPGDFIVHFAACPAHELKGLVDKYSFAIIDNKDVIDLDTYLGYYGFSLSPGHSSINEGYVTESQKRMFANDLHRYENVKKVAEIGFNAGHSAQIFFQHCLDVEVLSFDLNCYYYTNAGVEFMKRKYKERFTFIEGNSRKVVPEYARNHPDEKFDLIYIDGDHSYQGCYIDLLNCRKLATEETIVWVDDAVDDVMNAVTLCVEQGLMKIVKYNSDWTDSCGARVWIEARYLFPKVIEDEELEMDND